MAEAKADTAHELVTAVEKLTGEVKSLRSMLVADYPRRSEIRRKGLSYALVVFLVVVISELVTMQTISHCFLDASGRPPALCNAMPGYTEAIKQNEIRLGRFYELTNQIESNRLKVAELELEIEKLKRQG